MTTADDPADTRMMAIVHAALKRDLARARDVLAGPTPPQDKQREAGTPSSRSSTSGPKSTRELAIEGHWLIEGIDAEGYQIVVHKVPAVLRFVLIHGFGSTYRRQARTRWATAG